MKNLSINTTDVKRYFQFLGDADAVQTVCFLDSESKEVIKGYGVKFGTCEEVLKLCEKLQNDLGIPAPPLNEDIHQNGEIIEKEGNSEKIGIVYTLHSCLNLTNLKGRQTQHITQARVLCVDLDHVTESSVIKAWVEELRIGMVVESSPGKFHLYWKVDCNLEQWKVYQLALGYKFGGDLNLDQLSKTIRVPGVLRKVKNGDIFMPKIVYLAEEPFLVTDKNIKEVFTDVQQLYAKALNFKQKDAEDNRKAIKAAIDRSYRTSGTSLDGTAASVATPIVGRNSTLFSLVKEEVLAGNLEHTEAEKVGDIINGTFKEPLPEKEAKKTIDSAIRSAELTREKREERRREEIESAKAALGATVKVNLSFDYESTGALAVNRFTDDALIERVIQKHGHKIFKTESNLYAFSDRKKVWQSQRVFTGILGSFVEDCINDIFLDEKFIEECCTNSKGEYSEALKTREIVKWCSANKKSSAVAALKQDHRIKEKEISACDTNDNLFHCKNGVFNLETYEFRQAVAEDYLIRQSSVVFDAGAICPWWENFIKEIYAENDTPEKMYKFIQQVFGYTLCGSVAEQVIFIHTGEGANGKSRVLYALKVLLGEYASIIEPYSLSSNTQQFTKEFSRLGVKFEGKRGVIIDDLNTKARWDEALVKNLTSDTLLARHLYTEEREVPNHAKIHIGCNATPETESGGHAVFRRLCIINYPRTFKVDIAKYSEIEREVKRELSGIFNWAVKGYKSMLESGSLEKPLEVTLAVEDYESSSFNVLNVIDELFAAPDEGEESWKNIAEVSEVINSHLTRTGKRDKVLSVDCIGRAMAKVFESKRMRTGIRDNKSRFYNVKIVSTFL